MSGVIDKLEDLGSPKIAIKFLKSNGYKRISSGQFSIVFSSPDNSHVIKIQVLKDLIWWNYIDYVSQNHNEHFPVINDIISVDGKNRLVAASMEKLLPINKEEWKSPKMKGLMNFVAFRGYTLAYLHISLNPLNKKRAKEFYNEYFDLANAIDEAADVVHEKNGRMDMQPHNFMKRQDGTIVITDPGF